MLIVHASSFLFTRVTVNCQQIRLCKIIIFIYHTIFQNGGQQHSGVENHHKYQCKIFPGVSIQFNSILFTLIRNTIYFYGKKINLQSIIFKWFYLLGKKCIVAKGARLSCWPLPQCSYKNRGK